MSTPTRYPSGMNDHALGNEGMGRYYPQPDPARYVRYFNDFHIYTAGDWTVTETQAGATQAITAGHGGLLLLTNSAADNDLVELQLTQETFQPETNKKFWIRARFKVSDATDSDLFLGVSITDTSALESLPTDWIGFYKADGSTSLTAQIRKDGSASSITMGTVTADTFMECDLYYDGKGRITAMLDGDTVGTDVTVTTNIPNDEDLAVTIAVQNGAAAAKTLTVDYIEIVMER